MVVALKCIHEGIFVIKRHQNCGKHKLRQIEYNKINASKLTHLVSFAHVLATDTNQNNHWYDTQ